MKRIFVALMPNTPNSSVNRTAQKLRFWQEYVGRNRILVDVLGYGIFVYRPLASLKSVNSEGRLKWKASHNSSCNLGYVTLL